MTTRAGNTLRMPRPPAQPAQKGVKAETAFKYLPHPNNPNKLR